MRRNHENTNDVVKHNHADLQIVKEHIKEIRTKLDELGHQIGRATFQIVMNEVDMSDFFPVAHAAQLENFIDKEHIEWPARRREFYNYLFNCVTDNKRAFTKGLLKSLFSREYMMTVKWPSFGYDDFKLFLFFSKYFFFLLAQNTLPRHCQNLFVFSEPH